MVAFTARQTGQRAGLVQGENHIILMDLYARVLKVLEGMLDTSLFLFGSRPSLADFGLYGQLSQCAVDPSASAILRSTAPRTFQWTQTIDDASGIEGDWAAPETHSPSVESMLQLAGEFYLPFLVAHAQAASENADHFTAPCGGRVWHGRPERYKLKCLVWLRRELAAMPSSSRDAVQPMLQRYSCWEALQPDHLDKQPVPPMAPM